MLTLPAGAGRKASAYITFSPESRCLSGFIERFNGSYRREVLDAYLFLELEEVRELMEQWMEEYNTRRPHEALGNLTPSEWPPESRSGNMENFPPASGPTPQVYHIPTS